MPVLRLPNGEERMFSSCREMVLWLSNTGYSGPHPVIQNPTAMNEISVYVMPDATVFSPAQGAVITDDPFDDGPSIEELERTVQRFSREENGDEPPTLLDTQPLGRRERPTVAARVYHNDPSREMTRETSLCVICKTPCTFLNEYLYKNKYYCPTCFDERFWWCQVCNKPMPIKHKAHWCANCEAYFCSDECHTAHDIRYHKPSNLLNYSHKPPFPPFLSENGRAEGPYMGLELEIDRVKNVRGLMEALQSTDFNEAFYYKTDISCPAGIEIVSHPATLNAHLNTIPWAKLMLLCRGFGAVSHTAKTCGIHIHLDREYFKFETGYEYMPNEKQHLLEMKMALLFERFWGQMRCFSRRTPKQIQEFCFRHDPEQIRSRGKYKKYKGGYMSRHAAINTLPKTTIEIRLWRGTLVPATFFATLEFTAAIATYIKTQSIMQIRKTTWFEFLDELDKMHKFQYLHEYLKTRKLVNRKGKPCVLSV